LEGVTLLAEAVGNEKRPLSWTLGPQGVVKGKLPSLRDQKRPQRQKATTLRTPDHV
jgi:NADH-quinone oxidoreductase subunit B